MGLLSGIKSHLGDFKDWVVDGWNYHTAGTPLETIGDEIGNSLSGDWSDANSSSWDKLKNGETNEFNERIAHEANEYNYRIAQDTNDFNLRGIQATNEANLAMNEATNQANAANVVATNRANIDIANRTNAINKQIADENLAYQREDLAWQQEQQKKNWEREDTSYQRTVSDMRQAGISPLAMSGLDGAGALSNPNALNNAYQAQNPSPMQAAVNTPGHVDPFQAVRPDPFVKWEARSAGLLDVLQGVSSTAKTISDMVSGISGSNMDNKLKNQEFEFRNEAVDDLKAMREADRAIKENEASDSKRKEAFNKYFGINDSMNDKERFAAVAAKFLGVPLLSEAGVPAANADLANVAKRIGGLTKSLAGSVIDDVADKWKSQDEAVKKAQKAHNAQLEAKAKENALPPMKNSQEQADAIANQMPSRNVYSGSYRDRVKARSRSRASR